MPGYTCIVVPSAVQYAGLSPVYVDINPRTYNLDPRLLDSEVRADASAIVVQHTYGLPCDMGAIGDWAATRGIAIVEDSCHTFGTRVNGRLCGTFGKFAFMSGQWNKPFSTGLGGILLVNDPDLAQKVQVLIHEEARWPGPLRNLLLSLQIVAYDRLVTPRTAAGITALYRALNALGIVIGSSSTEELNGIRPDCYFSRMAPAQIRKGRRELSRIEANIRHRAQLTQFYHEALPRIGFEPVAGIVGAEATLLRYPVRVANKEEVLRLAAKRGVEIGSWFEVPLHPAGTRMEDFGYRLGMCPHAELACRQVINLPTHLKVDKATADRTVGFLAKHARPAGCFDG